MSDKSTNDETHKRLFRQIIMAEHDDGETRTLIIALTPGDMGQLATGKILDINSENAPFLSPGRRILFTSYTTENELAERLKEKGYIHPLTEIYSAPTPPTN